MARILSRELSIVTGLSHSYLGLRDRSWLGLEFFRRVIFRSKSRSCRTVVLSFPRSGNHAVRGFLEGISSRPTLGALDSERFYFPRGLRDLPLFLRKAGTGLWLREPIAVKRHHLFQEDEFEYLIYVERDAVEAILSHTRDMPDDEFELRARDFVGWWQSLRLIYENWAPDKRICVVYSDILSAQLGPLVELAKFVGLGGERAERYVRSGGFQASYSALGRPAGSRDYRRLLPDRAQTLEALLTA